MWGPQDTLGLQGIRVPPDIQAQQDILDLQVILAPRVTPVLLAIQGAQDTLVLLGIPALPVIQDPRVIPALPVIQGPRVILDTRGIPATPAIREPSGAIANCAFSKSTPRLVIMVMADYGIIMRLSQVSPRYVSATIPLPESIEGIG